MEAHSLENEKNELLNSIKLIIDNDLGNKKSNLLNLAHQIIGTDKALPFMVYFGINRTFDDVSELRDALAKFEKKDPTETKLIQLLYRFLMCAWKIILLR